MFHINAHIMFDFHIYIYNNVYIYTCTYGFYYIRMFTFLKQALAILSLTSVFALSGLRGLPRVALLRPILCLSHVEIHHEISKKIGNFSRY